MSFPTSESNLTDHEDVDSENSVNIYQSTHRKHYTRLESSKAAYLYKTPKHLPRHEDGK